MIASGKADEISLNYDHDAGITVYSVLTWLERMGKQNIVEKVPKIRIHTANPIQRNRSDEQNRQHAAGCIYHFFKSVPFPLLQFWNYGQHQSFTSAVWYYCGRCDIVMCNFPCWQSIDDDNWRQRFYFA